MEIRNLSKEKLFFKKWLESFESDLEFSIAQSLGYKTYAEGGYAIIVKRPTAASQAHNDRLASDALEAFRRDFVRVCNKHKILSRYLGKTKSIHDFQYVGEGLSEWQPYAELLPTDIVKMCRAFNLTLVKINKSAPKHKITWTKERTRMPVEIAKSLLCALQFSKGNRDHLETLQNLLEDKIVKMINTLVLKQKEEIIRALQAEIDDYRTKLKETAGPKVKRRIYDHIEWGRREIKKIKAFELVWSFGGYRGNKHDTQWANHFKDGLLKTILSEGKPKIIKSFKGHRTQRLRVIAEAEATNQSLLKNSAK